MSNEKRPKTSTEESASYRAYTKAKRDKFKGDPKTWANAQTEHTLEPGDGVLLGGLGKPARGRIMEKTWYKNIATYTVHVNDNAHGGTKYNSCGFNEHPDHYWYIMEVLESQTHGKKA